jgi:hypothetical protein
VEVGERAAQGLADETQEPRRKRLREPHEHDQVGLHSDALNAALISDAATFLTGRAAGREDSAGPAR